ncbi:cellulose biosynthesis cyclic di-GMP-binding regulatory protein BcsB [Rhizobium sp.]
MKCSTAFLALLMAAPLTALAATPFDMSQERVNDPITDIMPKIDPIPVAVPKVEPAAAVKLRYLVPFPRLTLDGEVSGRTWTIYLTPAQAAAAQKLNYGYRSSILVAPETSKIAVYVNDALLSEQPAQSPEQISERSIELPANLLKPGANKISFRAVQQHRTDCTIESTFQLWTEILPEKTYLSLDPNMPEAAGTIDDVKAIGVDKTGRTHFRIVVPDVGDQSQTDQVMRLSQALALLGRMPNQSFRIADAIPASDGPGEMTVVVGIASSLADILPDLPDAARTSAFTGFVKDPKSGRSVMVVSGPDRQSIKTAVETMATALDRPQNVQRDMLATQTWTGSETPFLWSGTSLTFAKLGVSTAEFSGRRFRTGFDVGVPADFYAGAYGEAQILLDAAYSSEVMPGSHIDVYVNGSIAATVPITSTSGGLLRHLPIRVTMRHFRPGDNRIEVEAVLQAKGDLACVPGAAAPEEPRFALFNSSEFRMPDFARIAELPNLSAISGTGFPYGRDYNPISLFLDRTDAQTLSVSATFLGKLAVAAGRPVETVAGNSTVRMGDGNAIFIGAISQIPQAALDRIRVADAARSAWGNQAAEIASGTENAEALDEWRTRVRGGSWFGQIAAFEDWAKQTFDISFGSLQFLPTDEDETLPPNSSSFLMAQGLSPEETGTWTVLVAPDGNDLQSGMNYFSDEKNWRELSGRMVMLDAAKKQLAVLPAMRTKLIETQPFSVANYRLIAANWLSTNILSYAALFAGFSGLLGLATSMLLGTFGRRK